MNPVELAREVEERFRRYLKTTFYFKDPDLRVSFENALQSGHLRKGPYLEATPVFKQTQTPRALFEALGLRPEEGFLKAIQGDRPLYEHQEKAIQVAFDGHNAVVATGTGSGKTEAFLYPILLHLYQEFQASQLCPGVRALVLYPMNALANDQRERLGEICKQLENENSRFGFTFGQYIGETPEDEYDSQRHARNHMADRLPGELVLRSEMRSTPPHVLLTNYSMLEYLLLRPDDSPLFDNGQARWWTFLVLDEAHQYRGSRGIEMGMLLRRLKQRLREGGRAKPFRCIATSATLAGGEGDRTAVAKFASDLFGEEFRGENVILGETQPITKPGAERLPRDVYRLLGQVLHGKPDEGASRLAEVATTLAVPVPSDEELSKTVGRILERDSRATSLRRRITGKPIEVKTVADEVFSELQDGDRLSALAELVELLLQAKNPGSGTPLLSARYHLFLRSLEGAFVSHWPEKRVFLDRRGGGEGCMAFEVALCRECGQHYFVGRIRDDRLVEAIRDPTQDDFGATFLRPIEAGADDDEENDSRVRGSKEFQLCVQCGEIRRDQPKCGHDNSIRVVKEEPPKDEDRADQMKQCGACGYSAAGRDPVREVVHGTDGPHAVIATTLYQNLPQDRKKVLAFADGRQEAAFFAWYLEDSYKDILSRNLVFKVAQTLGPHASEGLSLRELAAGLRAVFRNYKVFPPATGDLELRHKAWLALYREFLTDEPRISLEGVGLVRWFVRWPDWIAVPDVLMNPPWSLSEQEGHDLAILLLDTMRTDRAVELRLEEAVSLNWADLGLQASQMRVRVGPPRRPKGFKNWGVQSWDGKTGKRARLLAKILAKDGLTEHEAMERAIGTLRAVWESVRRCEENAPSSRDRLLLSLDDARRLNPDWWRLRPLADDNAIFQCDTCGRLQAVSVKGVCPRHRCPGRLDQVQPKHLQSNHYRILYLENLPGSLRVEEHTAQLDKEKAREFQREFRNGNIHVLSCSTTFELGVDLGDLDSIFLRNVPPEAFNYAQRVGRAGRRRNPGFAITYCRRGPHDLYHFAEPERMMCGKVRPPVLALRNEKIISRHIVATALSHFFRAFPERFRNVASFFKHLERPSAAADFKAFLIDRQAGLGVSLPNIVPAAMVAAVGLDDGSWIEGITQDESQLSLAEAEVASDYKNVRNLEKSASEKREHTTAGWAQRRAETIAKEDVLSFLSRKAVIPKYGFPVDVVELDPQRTQQSQESMAVSLQRDLAIALSEFAPTNKLVANKKLWTSYGLKRVAEREWQRKRYKRCSRHNTFISWEKGQPDQTLPCGDPVPCFEYVIPKFGFVTNREGAEAPTSRTARVFTTRPYFARSLGADRGIISVPLRSPLITMRKASPGLMAVLCEGRRGEGFYICAGCGAGFKKRESSHKTPYGQPCHGTLERVSLGYEFPTDVLQLQFHAGPEDTVDPSWFAQSLAYALVEGAAEILEVPANDLSATVAHSGQGPVPPIILYDGVPGGAGLVARLEDEKMLRDCLKTALERVAGKCGCAPNTSCYGCLRSYRNQFAHQHLQRGPVLEYLKTLLSNWL